MRNIVIIASFAAALSACATGPEPYGDTVSVQYDPNRFQMMTLQRAAEDQCRAKGYANAEPLDNEPNTQSVRWSYLTFGCFGG